MRNYIIVLKYLMNCRRLIVIVIETRFDIHQIFRKSGGEDVLWEALQVAGCLGLPMIRRKETESLFVCPPFAFAVARPLA